MHERLTSGGALIEPEARIIRAAVLLSDIQGFVPLVETFSRHGRDGLEALTWRLNEYFAELAEVIYGHGGDVLHVAGDAFLCCWQSEDSEGDAVLRAALAGKAIQARLDGRLAGYGMRFATRIGVGVGELCVATVGGYEGRWELIAAGAALNDAADAEKVAAPGEVVLSRDAWALVERRCEGRATADRRASLQAVRDPPAVRALVRPWDTSETDRLLRPCVPPAVRDRVAAGVDWLAEQRGVTVVMVDLPRLTAQSAASVTRLHAAVRAFQEVVERFEGTLRVDVDDKGIMALAVFGLPPRAHENDAVRAVHSAWALAASLEAGGGIGIATGRAFCGAFGSDLRRDYLLRGDVINLAARLMQAAGCGILCDDATAQATRGRIRFDRLDALVLKGRSTPVQTHRPVGVSSGGESPATPMIGRGEELARLAGHVARLCTGAGGGVAILEADAGLGKSRLLDEAVRAARRSGARVFTAAADAIESHTAYYAWRPVFATLFGLDAQSAGEAALARVGERMEREPALARVLPLLSSVLPVQIPDNEITVEMTGDVRAVNTRQLLVHLLADEARALPIVLAIEDAHWFDSSSWALLAEVVREVPSLLAIVTMRSMGEGAPAEALALVRRAGEHLVRLEGLSCEETAALIGQRLGVDRVPQALIDLVHGRVAGHPYFCEELLRTMLEAGAVRVVDGECSLGELASLDLPTSIEGVIVTRLDRLTQDEQMCLKVASVIGRVFSERALRETLPEQADRDRVSVSLAGLTALGLTTVEGTGEDAVYLFKHVITRDVTYQMMPQVQRQPLHRVVARWYEETYGENIERHYALLAFHWARAMDLGRSVAYLERAGRQAQRAGAFTEAVGFFSQAVETGRDERVRVDDVRRGVWEGGLGMAHYFLGDMQTSRLHLERAVELLDKPVPARGRAVAMLAEAALQALHRIYPRRFLGRAQADSERREEVTDCYRSLAQIYYLDGESAARLAYVTLRGVNVGEEAGPSPGLARNLSNLGTLFGVMGLPVWGRWYARRAVEMAEREGQYAAAAYVWSINSLGEAQQGAWAAAKRANSEALRRVQELGDFNLEAEVWVVRSTILLCEGDFAAAPEAWSNARSLARRNGNAQILCWSLLDEVDTLLGRDELAAAAAVLEDALAVPTGEADGSSTIDKQRATAMTRLAQGRHAEALLAADIVVDMVTRQPPTGYHWVDCCASAVEAYLRILAHGGGDASVHRRALERRVERGCTVLARLARTFGNVRARRWLLRGQLHAHHGRPREALQAFERAEAIARAQDMPFERARAQFEAARLRRGGERTALLVQAEETFSRLGARAWVRELRCERTRV